MRAGRRPQPIGRQGLANHRWLVGGQRWLLLHQGGVIVGWAWATAHVADNTFPWLGRQGEERMGVLSETAFHAAAGDPANLKRCQRGEWEDRRLVETGLSMLTLVWPFKKVLQRGWEYVQARWAFTMAAFTVLVSGMAASPTRRASCPSRSLSLVCKRLISFLVCKRLTPLVTYAMIAWRANPANTYVTSMHH